MQLIEQITFTLWARDLRKVFTILRCTLKRTIGETLHYNGDDSYFFVNGRQELKFKCKTDQLVKEKLCVGNFSDQWTASESAKTGLFGNIYDFVVDYEEIVGVRPIYDMNRYLMIKHNVTP